MQIVLLQHQLRLLQRERPQPPRLSRWEKLTLAVLTAKLATSTAGPRARLDQVLLLFTPETVLKWHRELVRRKWTFRRGRTGGRPAIPAEVEELVHRVPPAPTRQRQSSTWRAFLGRHRAQILACDLYGSRTSAPARSHLCCRPTLPHPSHQVTLQY